MTGLVAWLAQGEPQSEATESRSGDGIREEERLRPEAHPSEFG